MKQLFFAEGKFLGEGFAPSFILGDLTHLRLSTAYLCVHCGEVYGRRPVVREDKSMNQWQTHLGSCRRCERPRAMYVPGSIYRLWDQEKDPLHLWPDPAIKWELQRRLDYVEKVGTDWVGVN